MNTVADSLFSALMSWVRALVNAIWAIFSSERTTILEFLGKNWLLIVVALIAFGLVADWLIWLLRWQPYHLWAQRARRILHIAGPEEEEDEPRARAATMPERREAPKPRPQREESWLPLANPALREEDARRAMQQAESVPDASLGVYPGMRYDDSRAAQKPAPSLGDTQRFAAVHSEGPGAAEVARRRAEIDAWQQQLQEEARAKAEAEQARLKREAEEKRMRQAWEAAQAERVRQEKEAAEAERVRREKEAAEAERARQAQEKYQRELAQYEQQKAQYERELAEYQRQKAAYDAQMAQLAAQKKARQEEEQRLAAQRRKRAAQSAEPFLEEEQDDDKTVRRDSSLMNRMARVAQMIEPEQTEISALRTLPPRVDPREAYGPATRPRKTGNRRK